MPQPNRGGTTMIGIGGNRRSKGLNTRVQSSVQVLELQHHSAKTGELLLTLNQLKLHRRKLVTDKRRGHPRKARSAVMTCEASNLRSMRGPAMTSKGLDWTEMPT